MAPTDHPSAEELLICEPEGGAPNAPPDLRFLHYNDVYHVEAGSREPVGGYARFQTLVNYYRDDERFKDQPKLLTSSRVMRSTRALRGVSQRVSEPDRHSLCKETDDYYQEAIWSLY